MKKTGLYGYVCDFSADYDSTDVNDILDIHKNVMVKKNIMFSLINQVFITLLSFRRSLDVCLEMMIHD